MTLEESIYAHLAADSTITDIVGTRIYQGARKQGDGLPALSFDEHGMDSEQDITGSPIGLGSSFVEFLCYAETTKAAAALREAVRLSLQQHTGIMGGGVYVHGCLFENAAGGYDPDTDDVVRSVEFEIQFSQTTS
jgi:hypothetical protein